VFIEEDGSGEYPELSNKNVKIYATANVVLTTTSVSSKVMRNGYGL
jgi:hypothetical protein